MDTDKNFIKSLNRLIETELEGNNIFNAFGIILYDERHPFMRKLLSDNYILEAIHHNSGQNWIIYYQEIKSNFRPSSRCLSQLLILESGYSNSDLFSFFEIKNQRNPYFVFFYSPLDKINLISFEIKEKTIDDVKSELFEIINLISKTVNEANENNNKIGEGVFSTIDTNRYHAKLKAIAMNKLSLLHHLVKLLK